MDVLLKSNIQFIFEPWPSIKIVIKLIGVYIRYIIIFKFIIYFIPLNYIIIKIN